MTATIVSITAANSGAGGTVTQQDIAVPALIAAGDKAYLFCANNNNVGMSMLTAGWSADTQQNTGGGGARMFRKVLTGSESGLFSWTQDATGSRLACVLAIVRGAGTPAEAVLVDTTGPQFSLPSVTPSEDNTLMLAMVVGRHFSVASPNIDSSAGATSYTEDVDSATTNASGNIAFAWAGHKTLGAGTAGNPTASNLYVASNSTGGAAAAYLFSFPATGGGGGGGGTPPPAPTGWAELRTFQKLP